MLSSKKMIHITFFQLIDTNFLRVYNINSFNYSKASNMLV